MAELDFDELELDKLLKIQEVVPLVTMKRSWILQQVKDGNFPKPVRLGPRCVRWRECDVLEWIKSLKTDENFPN